jgi:type IV pilus assembly protein PilC
MALNKQSQLDFAQQLLALLNAGLALLNAIELIQESSQKSWQP